MRNELRYYEPHSFEKHAYFEGLSVGSEAIYRTSRVRNELRYYEPDLPSTCL